MAFTAIVLLFLGLALGALAGYLVAASRGQSRLNRQTLAAVELRARLEAVQQARGETDAEAAALRQQTLEQFKGLSTEALDVATGQLLKLAEERMGTVRQAADGDLERRQRAVEELVKPINETLSQVSTQVADLEKQREGHAAALVEQMREVRDVSDGVRKETASLVAALRKPQTRGAWGELHLKRSVEAAGMTDRVDFVEQVSVDGEDGRVRPDMVVTLVGGKQVVVDAKVPLEGFLDAHEATDEAAREERLKAHARHLRKHVDSLAAKSYWREFSPAPEFVVMFVPGESFLSAALEADGGLQEYAFDRRVVIATPATLVALLRTVAYAWTQEAVAANAQQVLDLAKELVARLETLGNHLDRVGRSLGSSVKAYNEAVGSYERRVLVTARKFSDLEVTESALEAPEVLEVAPRGLVGADLPESELPEQGVPTVESPAVRAIG